MEESKKDSKDILINDNTSKPEEVLAVSSTLSAAKIIKEYANYFTHLRSGSVTGIPAILLNEGTLRNLDVIVFLVNVLKDTPDFRAAAVLSEAVSRLVPNLSCDIGSLLVEAELVRNKIKAIRDNQARLSYIA
jgi:predicted ATP-grasp superfamily ATP-dependent carboligase